jgi:hypothetical protein
MPGGFDLLAQLLDLALALVLLAQLLLDGLHLLAQIVVALRLLHLVLHLGLDLGAQLLHLDLLGQVLVQQLQPVRRCSASPATAACRRWSGTAARRPQNPPAGPARRCSRRSSAARRRASATRRRSAGTGRSRCAPAPQRRAWPPAHVLQRLHSAIMNGSVWTNVAHQPHPLHAFGEDKAALVGHAHNLVHRGQRSHACRSAGLGASRRGSSCAATTIVRSSPSDSISWMELSRPTVSGSTAWGNSTVSRTGRTGILRTPGANFSRFWAYRGGQVGRLVRH